MAVPGFSRQVFRWLLDRVEDDRGNVSVYEYAAEDLAGIVAHMPWEEARIPQVSPQRYLKRICYGNRSPFALDGVPPDDQWMFEVVFDYGDHGEAVPGSTEAVSEGLDLLDQKVKGVDWPLCIALARRLGLDKESVFDPGFWGKLSGLGVDVKVRLD